MSRGRLVFLGVSVCVMGGLIAGSLMGAATTREPGADSLYKHLSVFTEAFSLVRQAYVDETPPEELMAGALDGTADALDPFSLYVPAAEVQRYTAAREQVAVRSGMLLLKERGVPYVVAVVKDGPAARAGIEAGDLVAKAGGRSTRTLPLWEMYTLLAGEPGTKLDFELIHMGDPKTVTVELGAGVPPPPTLVEERGAAVLRIHGFDDTTAARVRALLTAPENRDRSKLLVDLRGVAGGDPALGYDVARVFATGDLGALLGRDAKSAEPVTAATPEVPAAAAAPSSAPPAKVEAAVADAGTAAPAPTEIAVFRETKPPGWRGAIVVLQDRSTLGPAEVLATVLRQRADAKLVGETSFGYAGRQALFELSSGGRFQLTDAFYSGPDRKRLDDGLTPDLEVDERSRSFQEQDVPLPELIFDRGVKLLLEEAEPAKKAA